MGIGIEYWIEKGFLKIPEQTEDQEFSIPDWVRSTAKAWSDEQISDDELINGIQYLIEKGSLIQSPNLVSYADAANVESIDGIVDYSFVFSDRRDSTCQGVAARQKTLYTGRHDTSAD